MPRYSLTQGITMTEDNGASKQVDIEEPVEEAPKRKSNKPAKYENVSTNNIFTSKGRVSPSGKVTLSASEAKAFGEMVKKCP